MTVKNRLSADTPRPGARSPSKDKTPSDKPRGKSPSPQREAAVDSVSREPAASLRVRGQVAQGAQPQRPASPTRTHSASSTHTSSSSGVSSRSKRTDSDASQSSRTSQSSTNSSVQSAKKRSVDHEVSALMAQELMLLEKTLPAAYAPLNKLKHDLAHLHGKVNVLRIEQAPLKSVAQAHMLADFVAHSPKLRELHLHDTKISAQALWELSQQPKAMSRVRHLNVSSAAFGKGHMGPLAQLLQTMPHLESLSLTELDPVGQDWTPIFRALGDKSQLQSIDLRGNAIATASWPAFGKALKERARLPGAKSLQHMGLSRVRVDGFGGQLVARSLAFADTLQTVDLTGIKFDEGGREALVKSLKQQTKLREVVVGSQKSTATLLRQTLSDEISVR